eukprot:3887488-Rhodomonas_salina.4
MSGTDVAYGATRLSSYWRRQSTGGLAREAYLGTLSPYGLAMENARYCLRVCYGMPSTAYALAVAYLAMSGTEIAYGATRMARSEPPHFLFHSEIEG